MDPSASGLVTLRSTAWDGPAPHRHDLIVDGALWHQVVGVAAGAGLGHWTITARTVTSVPATGGNVYRWS